MADLEIIVAASLNNVIGRNGGLPWQLPGDLKYFRALTTNQPIIMGRKTFESIGKALPNRGNIVLSSRMDNTIDNVQVAKSPDQALDYAKAYVTNNGVTNNGAARICIIGGAEIYQHFIDQCQTIHLTRVATFVKGDTFFPSLDNWKLQSVSRPAPNCAPKADAPFYRFEHLIPK